MRNEAILKLGEDVMFVISKARAVLVVSVVGVLAFGWVSANQHSGAETLTGEDYGEIEALYARYNQGSDLRDAELFVSAFSEDAEITRPGGDSIKGMEALKAERVERYQGQTGDVGRRHWTGSYLITPTSTGAKGRAYYILLDVTTRPPTMTRSGYYEDEFVRTAAGWRIKHRTIKRDATGN